MINFEYGTINAWNARKAEQVLAKRGGGPMGAHKQLARWASAWTGDGGVKGVLVSSDGAVLGETGQAGGTWVVTNETKKKYGLGATALDMVQGGLVQALGCEPIHIKAHEVTTPSQEEPPLVREVREERERLADLQFKLEADRRMLHEQVAHLAHSKRVPVAQLARAAGVTRQTVYSWMDDFPILGEYD